MSEQQDSLKDGGSESPMEDNKLKIEVKPCEGIATETNGGSLIKEMDVKVNHKYLVFLFSVSAVII